MFQVLFFSLPAIFPAQAFEGDGLGPHKVGWEDVQFTDQSFNRHQVKGRVFYPATQAGDFGPPATAAGPFPLAGFAHGWTEPVGDYLPLLNHLASWGFVVTFVSTELGFWGEMEAEAQDLQALMHWANDQSTDPQHWLFQLVADGGWGALGHSMGRGAMGYLAGMEPRIRNLVMFEPYHGSYLDGSYPAFHDFKNYTGRCLIVSASQDSTCPPGPTVKPWFRQARVAKFAAYVKISGGGHFVSTIWPDYEGSLSGADQARLHFPLGSAFLRACQRGEDDHFAFLLGYAQPPSH